MDIVKNTNINFLKYKTPAMLISLAIILGGFLSIYLKHGLGYGVDFSAVSLGDAAGNLGMTNVWAAIVGLNGESFTQANLTRRDGG